MLHQLARMVHDDIEGTTPSGSRRLCGVRQTMHGEGSRGQSVEVSGGGRQRVGQVGGLEAAGDWHVRSPVDPRY